MYYRSNNVCTWLQHNQCQGINQKIAYLKTVIWIDCNIQIACNYKHNPHIVRRWSSERANGSPSFVCILIKIVTCNSNENMIAFTQILLDSYRTYMLFPLSLSLAQQIVWHCLTWRIAESSDSVCGSTIICSQQFIFMGHTHTNIQRKRERESFIWYHNNFHKFTIKTKFNVLLYVGC